MKSKKKNLVLGLLLILICLIFYLMIFQLRSDVRLYPLFTTTILLAFSIGLLVQNHFSKVEEEEEEDKEEVDIKQLLFVIVTSGVYVALMNIVGYVVSTLVYLLVMLFGLKLEKKKAILIGVGFTIFIYLLFKVALKVPLPKGFII